MDVAVGAVLTAGRYDRLNSDCTRSFHSLPTGSADDHPNPLLALRSQRHTSYSLTSPDAQSQSHIRPDISLNGTPASAC